MSLPATTEDRAVVTAALTAHAGYLSVLSLVDAVTFTVKRPYPAAMAPPAATSRTRRVRALLRVVVKRPSVAGGLARVIASADLSEPPAPRRPRPRAVVEDARFFYDPADGRFYREGPAPIDLEAIFDDIFQAHCRTLRWHARVRAALASGVRVVGDRLSERAREVAAALGRRPAW